MASVRLLPVTLSSIPDGWPEFPEAIDTLAGEGPSTGVLADLGFERVATLNDPDDGDLWRWRWIASSGNSS